MTEQTAPPPTALRVAAGLWLAIGVFLLVNVASVWVRRDELARVDGLSAGEVTDALVLLTAEAVFFSGLYGWLTMMLWRGRKWARTGLSAVAVVHLLWFLVSGVSGAHLVTLMLITAAVVLTWRPSAAQWFVEVGR